jgi:hypothetical protein
VFPFLGRARRQGVSVGGEDRRPRRQFDLAFQVLAAAQAGEDEARVPVDAAVRVGQLDLVLEASESDRGDGDRDRYRGLAVVRGGVVRGARIERAQRRHLLGIAVGDREIVDVDRRFRGWVQLLVHGREVVRGPGLGEAVRGFLLG